MDIGRELSTKIEAYVDDKNLSFGAEDCLEKIIENNVVDAEFGKYYILSFELDKKCIYSETLTVYESIRPTKLYSRSYDPYTDSSVI